MEIESAEVFVDTAGWGHLLDPSQSFHAEALELYRSARRKRRTLITTNYILIELVALLTSPLRIARPRIVAFIDRLRDSRHVEVVHVDAGLDQDAWELLRKRQDKAWSLVDCSSFVVMKRRDIFEALTSDRHFEQAGFRCLLAHKP